MQTTKNYGLKKPDVNEFYDVNQANENLDIIDEKLKEVEDKTDSKTLTEHIGNKNNPHEVTKTDVGLDNVPNVTTNDQTPTYVPSSEVLELTSGEKLTIAFGKIAKAILSLISHIGDGVKHITSAERTKWNAAEANVQSDWNVTDTSSDAFIKNKPTSMTPTSHNQTASTVTAGTFAGKVNANASAMATLTNAQLRDAVILATDPGEGASVSYPNGTIVFTK